MCRCTHLYFSWRENRKPVDEAVTYRDKEKYKTYNKEKDKADNEEIIRILEKDEDILKEAGRKEKPQETQSTLVIWQPLLPNPCQTSFRKK